ncbi:bacterio-opsin activator domain-containing protein [Natronorubrum sulfidifaciens]|uniref:PAS sensor protein n=1 Tax=Natronorubrum sulfidifaciens JCM 14089 TaxID=1230460 RepID=L9WJQ5_9EURY|nr:bacterio-opsin activator domain-containing protein [Natronorubrum sulfidifaciens]ELY49607.1 PAS sensor protein [Natronorubrum sulfidifaciens JCM 14089]
MTDENRPGLIIHVAATDSSSLERRLRESTTLGVRSVSPEAALETVFGSKTETREKESSTCPAGVVVELDCPTRTKAILERATTRYPAAPSVVVPPSGSETLAATALRADADEYIPADHEDDPIERVLETLSSSQSTDTEPEQTDRKYHHILANELPDEAFVLADDGTYLKSKVRPGTADRYSVSADELTGHRLEDVYPDDTAAKLEGCIDETLETGDIQSIEYTVEATDGRRRYEGRVVPIDERINGQRAVVWLARDITERARRERRLRSRQNQLETLNRINSVVGQVIETLVEARSRDAIEHEVCAQLVDSELYCGSWIAERTGEGTLTYRNGTGSAETYLEYVSESEVDHGWLARRAVQTGTIQTQPGLTESESVPDLLREGAREDDVKAAIAVPISYNESIYGVLTVLASREEAFTEGEQAGFGLLGETIGFTIMAMRNRQLLFADTVIELEFRIDGGDTFSFDLSRKYDCTCSLEWAGTTSGGRTVQYVTVAGLDCETVLEAADAHESVEECRRIHDGGESCTIELRLAESGVQALANHGATIREITVEDGVSTCLIEVSQDANVREIADTLTVVYENAELVARREVDRPVRTAAERCNRILDQLTDRQLTTLRLAYYSGFFDWPRESTGEEIAESMDVTPPTMHQHLRKGLKTVLGEFFETDGDGP